MDRDRHRKAEEELGLGEIPEDPVPEVDARTNDAMGQTSATDDEKKASLFRLPAWITIPLLLSFPFAAYWGATVAWEYLRYEVLISSVGERVYYVIPFLLQLSLAVVYYLGAAAIYLVQSIWIADFPRVARVGESGPLIHSVNAQV